MFKISSITFPTDSEVKGTIKNNSGKLIVFELWYNNTKISYFTKMLSSGSMSYLQDYDWVRLTGWVWNCSIWQHHFKPKQLACHNFSLQPALLTKF